MGHPRPVSRARVFVLALVGVLVAGCGQVKAPALRLEAPVEQAPQALSPQAPTMPVPAAHVETARLEPSCPEPTGRPLSAAQRNAMMARVDLPAWDAADVGTSAELSDGRVFWVYGDTFRSVEIEELTPDLPDRLVSNSVLVSSDMCFSQLMSDEGAPGVPATVPETENGLSQWPMSVVRVPPTAADGEGVTDVVVAFYGRTQRGGGQWDFRPRGTSVVVFLVGADGVPRMNRIVALTPDDVSPTAIHWGAAATVDGDHVYVYGTRATGIEQVYGRELYVSRLPVTAPTDLGSWEIWDGTRWQGDSDRAAPTLSALEGVSQMLSVDKVDGRWLAVSKFGGDVADNITVWSASEPYGPWEPRQVADSPFETDAGEIEYSPMAHPELTTPSGALLVSVSRNHRPWQRIYDNPELGRPRFLEVQLD
jgi:hypothetical protein